MTDTPLERLIVLFSSLPGLGPRSARRVVLHLIRRRETVMAQLTRTLEEASDNLSFCPLCNNLDVTTPCAICTDASRDETALCVVEDVADLWSLERTGAFKGRYHVLGGVLSAIDGVGPEDLHIPQLVSRAETSAVTEVILATNATVDGQTTAHYIAEALHRVGVRVSRLAQGVPVGGELDYLDEGTLNAAFRARRPLHRED